MTSSNPFQNEKVLQFALLEHCSPVTHAIGAKSPSVALKISPTTYSFGFFANLYPPLAFTCSLALLLALINFLFKDNKASYNEASLPKKRIPSPNKKSKASFNKEVSFP